MKPGHSSISLAQAKTGKSYSWCYRTLAREQEQREMEEMKLYTLKEVEKILKVTQRTLYTYIQNGQLKATKIGKYWRVKHADLMDFVDNGNPAKK
jgi:excisionase family DNA binding protein